MEIQAKIRSIEKEIRATPYHKATERHIGRLKARLAKLRGQLFKQSSKGKRGDRGYAVPKTGDATVVLVGPPSVGKSTLLNALTGAKSKVAEYEFTTLRVIPGIMRYRGAQIQILDVPGLVEGAASGKGRGKEILSVARSADLILLLTDIERVTQLKKMAQELHAANVRLNQLPPKIIINKCKRGGLVLNTPPLWGVDLATIKEVAKEFGLINVEITIEENITLDQLVDAFAGNRVYVRALSVVNKIDKVRSSTLNQNKFGSGQELTINELGKITAISSREGMSLDKLKEAIWEELNLIRVYLKTATGEVDYKEPLILKRGATIKNGAEKLSTDLAQEVKGAKIWGEKAIFPGQRVGVDYSLDDEMIVTFI